MCLGTGVVQNTTNKSKQMQHSTFCDTFSDVILNEWSVILPILPQSWLKSTVIKVNQNIKILLVFLFLIHSISVQYPFCICSILVPFTFLHPFSICSVPVRKCLPCQVSSEGYCINLKGCMHIHLCQILCYIFLCSELPTVFTKKYSKMFTSVPVLKDADFLFLLLMLLLAFHLNSLVLIALQLQHGIRSDFKVTSNLRGCPSEKNSYVCCFQGNPHKLYIKRKVIKYRIQ